MLVGALVFVIVVVAWVAVRRLGAKDDVRATERARARLSALATAAGWRVLEDASTPSIEDPASRSRLVWGDAGTSHGADVTTLVANASTSGAPIAVWPREPPDAAFERWGPEVSSGDPVFDARFAVLSRASRGEVAEALSDTARRALLDLGAPGLVVDSDRTLLVLPGIPDSETLARACRALGAIMGRR